MTRRVFHHRAHDQAGLSSEKFWPGGSSIGFTTKTVHSSLRTVQLRGIWAASLRFPPPPLPHRRHLPEQVKNEFLALRVLNKTDYSTMGLLDNALNWSMLNFTIQIKSKVTPTPLLCDVLRIRKRLFTTGTTKIDTVCNCAQIKWNTQDVASPKNNQDLFSYICIETTHWYGKQCKHK